MPCEQLACTTCCSRPLQTLCLSNQLNYTLATYGCFTFCQLWFKLFTGQNAVVTFAASAVALFYVSESLDMFLQAVLQPEGAELLGALCWQHHDSA